MSVCKGLIAFAKKTLGLPQAMEVELIPFARRGSDRTYFRFKWESAESVILVHYDPSRCENSYYPEIASFLEKIGIPIAPVISHDPAGCFLMIKDLGDTDLWSLKDAGWEIRQTLYHKTLAVVHRLHSCSELQLHSDQVRLSDPFGPDLYRWERNYFVENFIHRLCGMKMESSFRQQLDDELCGLAERLASGRCSLVHRDLQSQNVIIYGEEPFLIDFQGMRFGTRFYDLGSLLCDPYVTLSGSERVELLSFYYHLSRDDLDWHSFENSFWEASAQRLMQALGAYGYLGLAKGLKSYLAYIPAGLENLRIATAEADSLPYLQELSIQCEKILAKEDSRFEVGNSKDPKDH